MLRVLYSLYSYGFINVNQAAKGTIAVDAVLNGQERPMEYGHGTAFAPA